MQLSDIFSWRYGHRIRSFVTNESCHVSRDMCTWLVCHDEADRESRAHIARQGESCVHDSFMCTWVVCTYRETTWQNDSRILYMTHIVSRYVHMTRVTKISDVTWLILHVTWLILYVTWLILYSRDNKAQCLSRVLTSLKWLVHRHCLAICAHDSFVTMKQIESHVHRSRYNVNHVHMTE